MVFYRIAGDGAGSFDRLHHMGGDRVDRWAVQFVDPRGQRVVVWQRARCWTCYRYCSDHSDRCCGNWFSWAVGDPAWRGCVEPNAGRSFDFGATKQILEAVISTQSDAFREVVLVEYPRRGLWVIGFVTGSTKGETARRLNGNNVNVFIPTTPNPTSGFLLFCPKKDLIYMDMSVESAVKLVVSGGIITPPDKGGQPSAKASPQASSKKGSAKQAAGKKPVAKQAPAKKCQRKNWPAKAQKVLSNDVLRRHAPVSQCCKGFILPLENGQHYRVQKGSEAGQAVPGLGNAACGRPLSSRWREGPA